MRKARQFSSKKIPRAKIKILSKQPLDGCLILFIRGLYFTIVTRSTFFFTDLILREVCVLYTCLYSEIVGVERL